MSEKEKIVLMANDFSTGKNNFLHRIDLLKKKNKKMRHRKEEKMGIILSIYKPGEFNLGSLKGKMIFH